MNSLRRDEFSVESPELSLFPLKRPHSRLASHIHVTFTNQFIQIQRFDVRRRVKYLGGAITLVERNHLRAIPQVIVRPKQLWRRRARAITSVFASSFIFSRASRLVDA